MAKIDVGQRLPITLTWLKADGTPGEIGGEPAVTSDDTAVVAISGAAGAFFARGLTQGSVSVHAIAPSAGSGPPIELVGLVVVNDPADDATIGEMTFGAPEPDPDAGT